MCRTIGKASSEMRIYSTAPKQLLFDHLSEPIVKQASQFEGSSNDRASYFAGQEVYGDAILASVGYTWKSTDLFHEAVSLRTYYRYKLWVIFMVVFILIKYWKYVF